MASLTLLAAITQVRRIAENRSDSIVMVKKWYYDEGQGGCWGGLAQSVQAHVLSSPYRYKETVSVNKKSSFVFIYVHRLSLSRSA